ncbi:MAG: cell division protein ZapA [Spirochaetaceae bacterium]|nr:MAG: cell division protein ZapA [Spirochaetaceae bacterium]
MRIELLGQSFTIRSDEDPEYLGDLVDYFATKLQEVRDSVDTIDPVKLAILAGLITVDELFQAREEAGMSVATPERDPEEQQELERITERLITRLNETLDATPEHPEKAEDTEPPHIDDDES